MMLRQFSQPTPWSISDRLPEPGGRFSMRPCQRTAEHQRIDHGSLPLWRTEDHAASERKAQTDVKRSSTDQRCAPPQPQKNQCDHSPRSFLLRHGSFGSGKSSLISDILYPALTNNLQQAKLPVGEHQRDRRDRECRQSDRDRSNTNRKNSPIKPCYLHQAIR